MTGQAILGSQAKSWRELGSRAALVAGFGTLLVFMAFVCIDSLHSLARFEADNIQIRQTFLYREHTLDQIRANLYESANITSDYLLNENALDSQQRLRAELQSLHRETTAALSACVQSLPTEKTEPFERLAMELESYWSTIDAMVTLDTQKKTKRDTPILHRDLLSRNATILEITKDLSALNAEDLNEAEQRIREVSEQFRRRSLMVVVIGLGFGVVLAAATIAHAGRLESRLKQKYEESLQGQRELKELSRRLVDSEERERRAISRELHDEVGQSLGALLLDIKDLTETSRNDESFRQRLQNTKTLAEKCLNEVRDMALLLRPSMLDDFGLVPALEWQAREVSKRTGMLVDTVEENVSEDLPDGHRTCVYRVVQEALNNCSKHANAKNVRVMVRQEPHRLRVRVEDDGKGFDPRRSRGLGLIGMSERVTQLGGVLTVESDPARGTRLEVDLPLPGTPVNREN